MDPLRELHEHGQSIWMDSISRRMLTTGELARLVDSGITGVTSNPAIFEKAIAGSDDYDAALEWLLRTDPEASVVDRYEALAITDIREALDVLRPVYDRTDGADGFVSLEVSPTLADDAEGTIAEARRLWTAVDRPNLMIKVPATPAGVPAIETLIGEGINVNVTLIFSLSHYDAIAGAYIRGVERAPEPAGVASVASFFVSRLDTAVDAILEEIGTEQALALRGRTAVANAVLAYQRYRDLFEGEPFAAAGARGARPQRVLWASTGTKNPDYSDVLYVEELIGPNTVNTVPPATLDAFLDHGEVRGDTVLADVDGAVDVVNALEDLGIDLDAVTEQLQADGVTAFADAFDRLLGAIAEKAGRLASR
jgi:transaldolase